MTREQVYEFYELVRAIAQNPERGGDLSRYNAEQIAEGIRALRNRCW